MKRDWSNIDPDAKRALSNSRYLDRCRSLRDRHPIGNGKMPSPEIIVARLDSAGGAWKYYPRDKVFLGDLGTVGPYSFRQRLKCDEGLLYEAHFYCTDGRIDRGNLANPHDPREVFPSWTNEIAELFNEERFGAPKYDSTEELLVMLDERIAISLDLKHEFLCLKGLASASTNEWPASVRAGGTSAALAATFPFDIAPLPEAARLNLDGIAKFDFASLERFGAAVATASKARPNDIDLAMAHAWALVKIAESGVHIDDVGNDTRRATKLFQLVRKAVFAARPDQAAEFETSLIELTARVAHVENRRKK